MLGNNVVVIGAFRVNKVTVTEVKVKHSGVDRFKDRGMEIEAGLEEVRFLPVSGTSMAGVFLKIVSVLF